MAIVNSARKRLDELTPLFGHLVVDECHRVPSTLFTETVQEFPAKYMLGLSATPYRRDGLGKLIGWYLGLHRVAVDTATLKKTGAILRPEIITRSTDFMYRYDDNYQGMVSALVEDSNRNRLIAADIRAHQAEKGGLSLVVSDRTAHLEALAEIAGIGCILTGKIPAGKRRKIVEGLEKGEIPVLFSTLSLIGEGFDCPAMDALFLTSPIKFEGRLRQVVGRVLRPAEDKEPLVFDYEDIKIPLLARQARSRQQVFATM